MKYHIIHGDFQLSFPPSFIKKIPPDETISFLFWEDKFDFSEKRIDGLDNIYDELSQFVYEKHMYPKYRYNIQYLSKQANRILKGLKRRLISN